MYVHSHVSIDNVCVCMCVSCCQVCDLVLGKVPGSQVVTDVGAELSFILPSTATHHFPPLFDTLEGGTTVSSYMYTYTCAYSVPHTLNTIAYDI